MNDGKDKFEDHIELIDYLRVIWKWKYLIVVGTVICALVAAAISISMPKVYRVETILEPGVAEINESGKKIYVESPSEIKALIEGGSLNSEIIQQLKNSGTRNPPIPLQFMVNIPANTDLLKISYESTRVEEGIGILNQLIKSLSKELSDKINYFKTKYEKKIQENKSAIYLFQDELRLTETKISNFSKRLAELATEIRKINYNIKMMTKNRDNLINSRSQNDILAGFLYLDTIQQNLDIRNKISNQILDYTTEMEKAKSNAKRIQIKIDILSKEIEDLKQGKNKIKDILVLQSPSDSQHEIKTKMKRNIVLATIVGLFLMLFFVFFLEYVFKHIRDKDR